MVTATAYRTGILTSVDFIPCEYPKHKLAYYAIITLDNETKFCCECLTENNYCFHLGSKYEFEIENGCLIIAKRLK